MSLSGEQNRTKIRCGREEENTRRTGSPAEIPGGFNAPVVEANGQRLSCQMSIPFDLAPCVRQGRIGWENVSKTRGSGLTTRDTTHHPGMILAKHAPHARASVG